MHICDYQQKKMRHQPGFKTWYAFGIPRNEYVTIEYTSEPIRIRRVPKFGLCKQYDELPIVREDERNVRVPRVRR